MKSVFASSLFSSLFARGDPLSSAPSSGPEPPPFPSASSTPAASAPASAWHGETYRHAATLLHSGSVDDYVSQHALYPSSSWWLR